MLRPTTGQDQVPLTQPLTWLTPMNAEALDPREQPATLLSRLGRRVAGLALWHDAVPAEDWREQASHWDRVRYDVSGLRAEHTGRRSERARRDYHAATVVTGEVLLSDLPRQLGPLLALGQIAHVGKGASEGFGRFQLR